MATMKQLTENFNLSEFTNDDEEYVPDGIPEDDIIGRYTYLAQRLEDLRLHLGNTPIRITSGFRTHDEQQRINPGAMRSMHLEGLAVDVQVEGFSPHEVYLLCTADWAGGLGLYTTHVHLDCRELMGEGKARWKKL